MEKFTKDIALFEHNEIGYEKTVVDLENNKSTTINHATGTGKSFIALKFIYNFINNKIKINNKNNDELDNKKPKKVLYLAPTYQIIDQLFNSTYDIGLTPEDIPIDTMIYKNLLNLDMKKLYEKYDLIIMDEYHRTGALNTYQKIKELKRLLDNNNDGKRFIGLTATPKRYLDRERNMTEEIFDSREASNLPLAEAMLEGLLPVPLYINSKLACIGKLHKVQKKVSYFEPGKIKDAFEKQLEEIEKEINYSESGFQELIKKYITEKDAKYIIFANTIEEADRYYEVVDKWFEHLGPVKKYKVNSKQKYDRNRDERKRLNRIKDPKQVEKDDLKYNKHNLERFNKDKKGISIMVCVDVLNEGVHVKGIDGVILLRKTKSPRIYFQQIGRALSFSGRKKQIKIFDLVNNFDNHKAIYDVYQEVQEEAKRKIEENPENKEKYQSILDKFKILDETKQILDKLEYIEKQCSIEEIIKSRIEYAVPVLEKYDKKLTFELSAKEKQEYKKAINFIGKHYKYVSNNDLERLQKLSILLPTPLLKTVEERKEELLGFDSIHEYEKNLNDIFFEKTIEFINKENRMPEEEAETSEERKLAKLYFTNITNIKEEIKQKLIQKIHSKKIPLRSWEKVLFDEDIKTSDIEDIIQISKEFVDKGNILPEYLYEALTGLIIKTNTSRNNDLFDIIKKSDEIEALERQKINEQRKESFDQIINYLSENIEDIQDFEEENLKNLLGKLQKGDINYIKRKFESFKKDYFKKNLLNEVKDNNEFFKMLKLMDEEQILQYYKSLDKDNEKSKKILEILKFSKEKSRLPDVDSSDNREKKLAQYLQKNIENNEININLEEIASKNDFYDPLNIIGNIVIENLKRNKIQQIILQNIEFYRKNGRRPLKNSLDEKERKLATIYDKKCLPKLTQEEEISLNKILNAKKSRRKACLDYIRNMNLQERG